MDFDFNWILVPATLVFFLIWLLDKFVFKQQSGLKAKKQGVIHADQHVQQLQNEFQQLRTKYPQLSISDTVSQPEDPIEVSQLRDRLSQARVQTVRAHNDLNEHKVHSVIGWAYDFWPVLAIVLVVRSFFFEPFNIPSESMNPTLETGDFILVNKYAYGVRLPLVNYKFIDIGEPEHGDVAVFRYPENEKISYIKRIIGLPGDHIAFRDGELFLNGKLQPYQISDHQTTIAVKYTDGTGQQQSVNVGVEQWVVNIAKHRFITQYIQKQQQNVDAKQFVEKSQQRVPLSLDQTWEVTVPEGQYFAMGDNRDQSADSRYWGFVPEKNLTGKAVYLWMHKAPGLNIPSFKRNGSIP